MPEKGRGLGQFANLIGDLAKKEMGGGGGVDGGGVETPMHTMNTKNTDRNGMKCILNTQRKTEDNIGVRIS